MSSFRNIGVTCPACNNEGAYRIWDSVNVDLSPNMKPKVMDGSLFEWVCPTCKKKYTIPYPFLYHDMTHHFMVQFDPEEWHIIPFAECLRIMEYGLERSAILVIAFQYQRENPKKRILFDSLSENKDLIFSVLDMPSDVWEFTDQKYKVTYDDYLSLCEDMNKTLGNNGSSEKE